MSLRQNVVPDEVCWLLCWAFSPAQVDLGPIWYPVALAVSVMRTAWLGGVLHRASSRHDIYGRETI